MTAAEGTTRDDPVYAASIAIFSDARWQCLLLGVRRPLPNMLRHPGVLSTVTMRLPRSLFFTLAPSGTSRVQEPGVQLVRTADEIRIGRDGSYSSSETAFVVEGILTRKLGLDRAFALQSLGGQVRLAAIALNDVQDHQGTGDSEWTRMLTYALTITSGADEIPAESPYYSRLLWAPTSKMGRAFRTHDALMLDETLNPFEVCVDGLCVQSAVACFEEATCGTW